MGPLSPNRSKKNPKNNFDDIYKHLEIIKRLWVGKKATLITTPKKYDALNFADRLNAYYCRFIILYIP